MKKPDFLLCAPLQVANSHGVLGMIQLAKTIESLGRKAYMCQILGDNDQHICTQDLLAYQPQDPEIKRQLEPIIRAVERHGLKLFNDFTRARIDASHVIYPECVLGNPLEAKHVVRYFLNKDGILKNGSRVNVGADDFLLAHSRVMQPNAHHVCHFSSIDALFNRAGTAPAEKRTMDVTYVGKGALFGFSGKIDNTVAVTRTWPATKQELAVILRNCRFFYTADACSNINNEALSCGAIPVFVHNGPWTEAEIDRFEPGNMPRVRLDSKLDDEFFSDFEVQRDRYLRAMQAGSQQWQPSVREFIEKVDRHFAPHAVRKLQPPRLGISAHP